MGYGDPETDACAHGLFALTNGLQNRIPIGGIDFPGFNENVHHFPDGVPTFCGSQFRNDLGL